jgi:hypothetical protein
VPALDGRTEALITTILDARGRVRPEDLASIPHERRAEALAVYALTHSASQLRFEGETLVATSAGLEAPPVSPVSPVLGPRTSGPGASDQDLAELGLPEPVTLPAGQSGVMAPEAGRPAAGPGVASEARAHATSSERSARPEKRLRKRWWLLPVLLGAIGGGIAYLLGKGTNESQARRMLYTGVILTLVELLIVVVIVSLRTFGPWQPVEVITLPSTTAPTVATSTPVVVP